MDSLYENVNLFHEEFVDSSEVVSQLKLGMCSLTMDVRAIRDNLSSSKPDSSLRSSTIPLTNLSPTSTSFTTSGISMLALWAALLRRMETLAELTEKVGDLTTYCEKRFEPQEDLLLDLQSKIDSQQKQIDSPDLHGPPPAGARPRATTKPDEPDWDTL